MNFIDLAKKRYSCRSFADKPIEKEKLDLILEAGRVAPTACNYQPQRIICVNSLEGLEALKRCTTSHYNCKAAFIIMYDKDVCFKRSFDGKISGDIDASIVTTHMMLEAEDLGIGSTWVMYFDPKALKEEFNLSANLEPTAILILGYPSEDATCSNKHLDKHKVEEISCFK